MWFLIVKSHSLDCSDNHIFLVFLSASDAVPKVVPWVWSESAFTYATRSLVSCQFPLHIFEHPLGAVVQHCGDSQRKETKFRSRVESEGRT